MTGWLDVGKGAIGEDVGIHVWRFSNADLTSRVCSPASKRIRNLAELLEVEDGPDGGWELEAFSWGDIEESSASGKSV